MSTVEGLRERKKRRTRAAIADAALELFDKRGFDAVTVADVAEAAEVSEKTIFNYFASKEDLVFEGAVQRSAALSEAVRNRGADVSIVEPFRRATDAFIKRLESEPVEAIVAVPRLVMNSKSLRERLFLRWEQEGAELAPAVAAAAGEPEDSIVAGSVARSLAWTHRLVVKTGVSGVLRGEDPHSLAADLRSQARRAYDLLEHGLAGYGS
jgi:AcrR family transcriptional regulator